MDFVEDSNQASEQQKNKGQDQSSIQNKGAELSQKNKQNFEKNNTEAEESAAENKTEKLKQTGDLDIKTIARIFAGEIIEVDQSILENRGGN